VLTRTDLREAAHSTRVRHDGRTWAVPPFDVLEADGFAALPALPGVSFVYNFALLGSAFGDLEIWQEYRDGQRVACGTGSRSDATMSFGLRCAHYFALQAGAMDSPEAIQGGSLTGDWHSLQMIAGFIEGASYRRVWSEECSTAGDAAIWAAVAPSAAEIVAKLVADG
jgi:hypothetical protein